MNIEKFKEPDRFKADRRDPSPRGVGDNNRGFHEPKQSSNKIFQNPEEKIEPYEPEVVKGQNGPFKY